MMTRPTRVRTLLLACLTVLSAGTAAGAAPAERKKDKDKASAPLYLNIIWHQHQPLYVHPEKDQLSGPWVRTHATKDYFDMAAMLRRYPSMHCTINLTSSLLVQLREYYLNRLGPFINLRSSTFDVPAFLAAWEGKTDPWIDLALKPAELYSTGDRDLLYRNPWNAFGVSEVMLARFPDYAALRARLPQGDRAPDDLFTTQEQREIIVWFYLAQFDPDFLRGPVRLPGGTVCDLSDMVVERSGKFHLRRPIGPDDGVRMVFEAYKVMAAVLPIHRSLRYDPVSHTGQIEIVTTPFTHPILPLLYDSDLARASQPGDPLPPRFAFPADAEAQVARSVKLYTELMGSPPSGMWPGEGSVAQEILPIFARNGILWTASDVQVLHRSLPAGKPNSTPYRFPAGQGEVVLVFRDTELSDRIGFTYQNMKGEAAAEDFMQAILRLAPKSGEPDALLTVILDGENAWEWYRQEIDGKGFLNAFYRKLTALDRSGRVRTTTVSEYIAGNPSRSIPAHPVKTLPAMERLWAGSWINGNFDTWIGEPEENRAWEYLLRARTDLEKSGVPRPDPIADPPPPSTRPWYAFKAWEEMYAAEGSDWFWWYGADQSAPGGDAPFDEAFRIHLDNIYRFGRLAGGTMPAAEFPSILSTQRPDEGGQGTMARAGAALRRQHVLFVCDASAQDVPRAIAIAGSDSALGAWSPNTVWMRDDGLEGDEHAGDRHWSLRVALPVGATVSYKFTNSGAPGQWVPSEEFPGRNRSAVITQQDTLLIIRDTFGH